MDFLPHSFAHAVEQGRTSRKDNVLEKVFSYINVTFLHGGIAVLVHSIKMVEARLFWAEKNLSGLESLGTDQDFPSIGELVILLASMALLSLSLSSLEVIYNVAHFFLDVLNDFELGISSEAETLLVQNLLQIGGDVSSGQVDSLDGVGDSITFINWHSVRNSVTGIKHHTGGPTVGVEGQH